MERDWSGDGEFKEIVQIGAIRVETENFAELGNLSLYVKPVKNPILSEYFMRLTGITQEEVDGSGIGFPEALRKFSEFAGESKLYSWGGDHEVLRENADMQGIGFPFMAGKLFDIREIFRKNGVETRGYMSSTIPRAFDTEPPPLGHNALNDARSIAYGLRLLKNKVESNG